MSLEPSRPQAEHAQLLQPGSRGEELQPSDLKWPSLNLLPQIHLYLVLVAQEMDAAAGGVSPDWSREEAEEQPHELLLVDDGEQELFSVLTLLR